MTNNRGRRPWTERRAGASWLSALFAGLALLLASVGDAGAQDFSAGEAARLLSAGAPGVADPADRTIDDRLLDKLSRVGRSDPAWPLYSFLRAEMLLRMQRTKPAADGYRSLVEHAASNPYQDTWGGSGLAAFALYRWLQLQPRSGSIDRAVFEKVSLWADSLLETRLVRSAFRPYAILSSMPLLEEQLYHALATEALRVGMSKKAGTYFLNYLNRLRSKRSSPEADPLYQLVLDQGISTPDRIALFRGKRLVSLDDTRAALPFLETASRSAHEQTRLEAKYLLARASGTRMTRAQKTAIYREVHQYAANDDLAQNALLHDALQFGPEEPEYRSILAGLLREYPRGPSADEALRWLAWGARITRDLDGALAWYKQLRELHRESRYLGSVAIHTALALVWRGGPKDLDAAAGALKSFIDVQPNSNDRSRAQFWFARIAEEQGDEAEARRRFAEAAKSDWFGYYGLRSRMHLAGGRAARSHILIENPTLEGEIRSAYSSPGSASSQPPREIGVYGRRLQTALGNGLYRLALAGEAALRRANASKRLQEFTFEELDELGFVTPIAVMMALRQDALAAADSDPSLPGRLALARHLGDSVSDWPVLLSLVHPASIRAAAKRSELMLAPGYLRTAYPSVLEALVRNAVSEYRVSPAILYAIMRQESFFYPAALSSAGALGLFQFVPGTFNDLDKEWRLLQASGAADRAAYLMDERLSVSLGARWFAQKKLPVFDNHILFAILAHHSGDGRVRRWQRLWSKLGWNDDVEMIVESFRMLDLIPEANEKWGEEAREFARHVMADVAIVNAIGLYGGGPSR